MLQEILILLIFLAAVAYIGRLLYRSFSAKSGCTKGCGSACSGINFAKLEKELERKQAGN